jgi:ubiquinone/menaquinone biosynthesis C-methylase UbiE
MGTKKSDIVQEVAGISRYGRRLYDHTQAEKYALRFERGSRKRVNQREQAAVADIFSRLGPCESTLDVPCGAGRFLPVLSLNSRAVFEADISVEILSYSRQRAGSYPCACRFLQADASRLPLADGAVDCVFCNRLLHHIHSSQERMAILKELQRVTRRYAIVSFFDYQSFGRLRRLLKNLKGRQPQYHDQPSLAQFTAEVERCGFRALFLKPIGPFWMAEKYFVLAKQ